MNDHREVPFGRPWITDEDRRAVLRVLEGHILTHGPECSAFEKDFGAFLGAGANCVSVSSCMAALHLAYLHFEIGEGDEVIVPSLTHVATAHAVEWVKAKPVFVDCDTATGNMALSSIEQAITPRTKAISLVHFAGIPYDMPKVVALAEKHDLRVIEDCAIALGSRFEGTHVGLFGDAGCFSFYPVKHITTGEGGMFVTRHEKSAAAVARLRAFGVDRTHTERQVPGMYEVPSLGLNYRMSEMQAALGRTQIARIEENLSGRRRNFETLRGAIADLPLRVLDSTDSGAVNSHYCLIVVLDEAVASKRDAVVAHLKARGVGTSVYYPQPVPRMAYYRNKYGYDGARYPNTTRISDGSIALPVGWHVGKEDLEYVARCLREAIGQEKSK